MQRKKFQLFCSILSESVRAMESGAWFLGQSRLELPYINISSEGISVSFAFRTYFSEAHLAQINDTSVSFECRYKILKFKFLFQ